MFSCCPNKDILTNVIEPSPIKPKKVHLLTSPGSEPIKKVISLQGTILFNDDPPTPDLTPEEIQKIQTNLFLIKEFHEALVNVQDKVLQEVWPILLNKSNSDVDSKTEWRSKILSITSTVFSVAAAACAISTVLAPAAVAFGIASAVIGVTATFVGTDKRSSDITGFDISSSIGYDVAYNTKSFNAMVQSFDYYHDNVNDNRDTVFKMNDKKYTMRDLINMQISKGTIWDNMLILAGRKYRNEKVIEILVKEQFLDLYFIQDCIDHERDVKRPEIGQPPLEYSVEHGHCYQPCGAPAPPGTQRCKQFNVEHIASNRTLFTNAEVVHFRGGNILSAAGGVTMGISNDDIIGSYLTGIKNFATVCPSCYVYPWSISDKEVLSQRWYIVLGKPKLKDDKNNPFYTLAEDVFLNWLFIDDGAGNILNPEGVAFRYDVLRTKEALKTNADVYLHAQQIGNQTAKSEYNGAVNHTGNLLCESWDYRYGPKDISKYNEDNHVYVGDIMNVIVNKTF